MQFTLLQAFQITQGLFRFQIWVPSITSKVLDLAVEETPNTDILNGRLFNQQCRSMILKWVQWKTGMSNIKCIPGKIVIYRLETIVIGIWCCTGFQVTLTLKLWPCSANKAHSSDRRRIYLIVSSFMMIDVFLLILNDYLPLYNYILFLLFQMQKLEWNNRKPNHEKY